MRLTDDERRLVGAQVSRKETVLRIIRSAILDGRLTVGTRLNQDEIAAELGVSRMPVREAVKQLEAEGLVVVYPYKGVEVAQLDVSAIEEMFGIRIALEKVAIARAVEHLTDRQLDRMKRTLGKMDEALKVTPVDADVWMKLNDEFHSLINEAAGWSRLAETIDVFRSNVDRYVRMYLSLRGREQPQKEHWALLEACQSRDAAKAQTLIEQHLWNTSNALIQAIASAHLETPQNSTSSRAKVNGRALNEQEP
ncbi:transcriptional regulator [Rubellimicrobium mesophilum DSM 19309]|uniref:Transcriptional regulator n=1 Tax=Rubellimicrobium mesophilum DSM 19309 TaxID=442562 RepID=A0A017HLW7_9RHOB|nr:GntR family transcriptional regulator [Rubellimicrobium mesophilum]EYD75320.1 transcriptional regulator [Rubellimicrobium mesophilum DSM 19309]